LTLSLVAFDTNVLAYAARLLGSSDDKSKALLAEGLIRETLRDRTLVLATQTCLELHWLLVRKAKLDYAEAMLVLREYLDGATLVPTDLDLIQLGLALAERHRLQTFDAIILAAAAEAGCDILYSEDMQDGFEWEGVRIVNPFV
jgi:predicted nucleic acid-binding protein